MARTATAPREHPALVILSDVPGRLRLRLGTPPREDDVRAVLADTPGVIASSTSSRTRSVLVRYRPGALDVATLLERLATRIGATAPPRSAAEPGAAVRESFGQLDAGLRRVTAGQLGLGALLPLGLVVWAATELLRGRAAPLAWSTALWYAHGLFRDYQLPGDH